MALAAPVEADAEAAPRRLRILAADDHPTNRRVVELILDGAAFVLMSVENGAQAVETYRAQTFDLVLMDMQMPIMDGYTATTIIRTSSQWDDIPVIALTAHAMKTDIDKCIKAGCNYYLSKPFTQEQLAEILSLSLRAASALENKNSG